MVLISLVGMFAGTILAKLVTGAVSKRWNWESAFYIFGVIGCIWFVAFFLMIHPTPEQDRTISKAEKEFIIKSLGNVEGQSGGIKHPWKGILTSKPVFAILVSGFCQSWGFYNMLTQLPSFLKGTSTNLEQVVISTFQLFPQTLFTLTSNTPDQSQPSPTSAWDSC